jgi:hypothetical protein
MLVGFVDPIRDHGSGPRDQGNPKNHDCRYSAKYLAGGCERSRMGRSGPRFPGFATILSAIEIVSTVHLYLDILPFLATCIQQDARVTLRPKGVLRVSLAWLTGHVEQIMKCKEDWWPYGVEKTRKTLETICQYSYEQGLLARKMEVEELFAPEIVDGFRI